MRKWSLHLLLPFRVHSLTSKFEWMYFLPFFRNEDRHILVGNYFRNTQNLYSTFAYRYVCYLNKWHLKSWNLLLLIQHFKGINLIFNRKNQSTFQKQQLMTQSSHNAHRNASYRVNIHAFSIHIMMYICCVYTVFNRDLQSSGILRSVQW